MSDKSSRSLICPFCSEAVNPAYYKVLDGDWSFPNRIMYRAPDDGAVVFPGIGPLSFPYALVVPRVHQPSLFSCSLETRESIFDCLGWAFQLPSFRKAGGLVVFEHGGGSTPSESSCQCINHCHLHLIGRDVGEELIERFRGDKDPVLAVFSQTEMPDVSDYLLAGVFQGNIYGCLGICPQERSQYFRRVLANIVGSTAYDWRQRMNPELMERLYREAQESRPTA